jgi:hypothetical protein
MTTRATLNDDARTFQRPLAIMFRKVKAWLNRRKSSEQVLQGYISL